MLLVVADTSPINYLLLIGAADSLRRLFDLVVIPPAVYGELSAPDAPELVKNWVRTLPPWIEVRPPRSVEDLGLHPGETEAIALAREVQAFAILLDDRAARKVAQQKGLAVTGLVALLEKAANAGFVDLPIAIERLKKTDFRIHPKLLKDALDRYSRTKRS